MVGGVYLSIVPQCSGQIDQLLQDQDGCQGGGESADSSAGAVAGGVVTRECSGRAYSFGIAMTPVCQ